MERLAGKTLTNIEVHDLSCAETLCTHDLTPPLGDPEAPIGGYVAKVIERDGFRCQRPGCSNRTALTGSHVKSRGRGGSEEPENILTLCMVCHTTIERGLLKTTGHAPDQIQWEGPLGIIEWPLEAASRNVSSGGARYKEPIDEDPVAPLARETSPDYCDPTYDSRESSLSIPGLSAGPFGGPRDSIACVRLNELSGKDGGSANEGSARYEETRARALSHRWQQNRGRNTVTRSMTHVSHHRRFHR